MAVIVRGSAVSGQAAGTSSGSFVIATPSATVSGDYLIILLTTNHDAITPAAGWTLLQNGNSASFPSQSLVYGRVASASGVTNYTWSISGTTAAPDVAVCWAFGNVDSTKIVSAVGAEQTTSSISTPAVTTTAPSLMLHLIADRRGSAPSITWTYPGGRTKTEGTNDGSVGYTASGAPDTATTVATGSQPGISLTGSAAPSTAFAYQVGLGDALVAVPAADGSTNIIDTASIRANIAAADTGSGTDTAVVVSPVPSGDTGTGVDAAKLLVFAAEAANGSEATKVVSGGSTLAFASDSAVGVEGVGPVLVPSGDVCSVGDVQQTATIGIQGPLPPGPRIARVMPAPNA